MNATEKFIIKIAAVAMVVLGIMSCCADRHFKGIDTGLVINTSGNTLVFEEYDDKTGTVTIDPNENTHWITITAPEQEPEYVRAARADLIAGVDRIMGMIEADMAEENITAETWDESGGIETMRSMTELPTTDWLGCPDFHKNDIGLYRFNSEIGLRSDGIVVWREIKFDPNRLK